MSNVSDEDELTEQDKRAWNVACDGYARLKDLYLTEGMYHRDILLVASFIIADLSDRADVHELVESVRCVALQILRENLIVTVSRPDEYTVIVDTKTRYEEDN